MGVGHSGGGDGIWPSVSHALPLPVAAHVGVLRVQGEGNWQEGGNQKLHHGERHPGPCVNRGEHMFQHLFAPASIEHRVPSVPHWNILAEQPVLPDCGMTSISLSALAGLGVHSNGAQVPNCTRVGSTRQTRLQTPGQGSGWVQSQGLL